MNYKPAIGLQAGLGVQVSRNFGVDLNYVEMNQTLSTNGASFKTKESGVEIGMNATF